MLIDTGVGARMQREAMVHDGIFLAFNGAAHKLDFAELIDKHVYIYDQKEVVTDLIAKRLADGGQILFEATGSSVQDFRPASRRSASSRAARRRRSNAISSPAATAFTASAARACRRVRGKATTASILSGGSGAFFGIAAAGQGIDLRLS